MGSGCCATHGPWLSSAAHGASAYQEHCRALRPAGFGSRREPGEHDPAGSRQLVQDVFQARTSGGRRLELTPAPPIRVRRAMTFSLWCSQNRLTRWLEAEACLLALDPNGTSQYSVVPFRHHSAPPRKSLGGRGVCTVEVRSSAVHRVLELAHATCSGLAVPKETRGVALGGAQVRYEAGYALHEKRVMRPTVQLPNLPPRASAARVEATARVEASAQSGARDGDLKGFAKCCRTLFHAWSVRSQVRCNAKTLRAKCLRPDVGCPCESVQALTRAVVRIVLDVRASQLTTQMQTKKRCLRGDAWRRSSPNVFAEARAYERVHMSPSVFAVSIGLHARDHDVFPCARAARGYAATRGPYHRDPIHGDSNRVKA